MRHALADVGGRRTRAAIGGGSAGRDPGQSFGLVAVSAAEIMRPASQPNHGPQPAPPRRRHGAGWIKLLLAALVLIGVAAGLVRSIWSRLSTPPRR
jgi:hypothetical protein